MTDAIGKGDASSKGDAKGKQDSKGKADGKGSQGSHASIRLKLDSESTLHYVNMFQIREQWIQNRDVVKHVVSAPVGKRFSCKRCAEKDLRIEELESALQRTKVIPQSLHFCKTKKSPQKITLAIKFLKFREIVVNKTLCTEHI